MDIWTSADGTQTMTTVPDQGGFRATCPKGHQNNHDMAAADVRASVGDKAEIELWCRDCGHGYLLPPDAVENLRR